MLDQKIVGRRWITMTVVLAIVATATWLADHPGAAPRPVSALTIAPASTTTGTFECGFLLPCTDTNSLLFPNDPNLIRVTSGGPENNLIQGSAAQAWLPLEIEARAFISAMHDIPNDNRLIAVGSDLVRGMMFSRLIELVQRSGDTLANNPLTVQEVAAVEKFRELVVADRVAAAQTSLDQYDLWAANPCGYQAPRIEYPPGSGQFLFEPYSKPACNVLFSTTPPAPPTFEQFQAYGAALNRAPFFEADVAAAAQRAELGLAFATSLVLAAAAAAAAAAIAGTSTALSFALISAIGSVTLTKTFFVATTTTAAVPILSASALTGAGAGLAGSVVGIIIIAAVVTVLGTIKAVTEARIRPSLQEERDRAANVDLADLTRSAEGAFDLYSTFFLQTMPDYTSERAAAAPAPQAWTAGQPLWELSNADGTATELREVLNTVNWDGLGQQTFLFDGYFVTRTRAPGFGADFGPWRLSLTLPYAARGPNNTFTQRMAGIRGDLLIDRDFNPVAFEEGGVPRDRTEGEVLTDLTPGITTSFSPNLPFTEDAPFTKVSIKGNRPPTLAVQLAGDLTVGGQFTLTANAADPDDQLGNPGLKDVPAVRWFVEDPTFVNVFPTDESLCGAVTPPPPLDPDNPSFGIAPTCPWRPLSGPVQTLSYSRGGTFRAVAVATDEQGVSAVQRFSFTIGGVSPVLSNVRTEIVRDDVTTVVPAGQPIIAIEGEQLNVRGTLAYPGVDAVALRISWGDGTSVRRVYPCQTLELGIDGNVIDPDPPGCTFDLNTGGIIGAPASPWTFSFTKSFLHDVITPLPANHTIRVWAELRDGTLSEVAQFPVVITNVRPVTELAVTCDPRGPFGCLGGDPIVVDAGATAVVSAKVTDVIGARHLISVDWGDGNAQVLSPGCTDPGCPGIDEMTVFGPRSTLPAGTAAFRLSHVYNSGGVFNVKVTVDDGTDSVERTRTITALSRQPVLILNEDPPCAVLDENEVCLNFPDPRTADIGESLRIRGSIYDADGDPLTLEVDWGDGTAKQTFASPCEGDDCVFGAVKTWPTACGGFGLPCLLPYAFFDLSHVYATVSGSEGYLATLTVSDGQSNPVSTTRRLFVVPESSLALEPMTSIDEGDTAVLEGEVNADSGPFVLQVDWGDSSSPSVFSWPCADESDCVFTEVASPDGDEADAPAPRPLLSFKVTRRYLSSPAGDEGTFEVAATVTRSGVVRASASTSVVVNNLPPVVVLNPDTPCSPGELLCFSDPDPRSGDIGSPIHVRGYVLDPGGDAGTLTVDWGDGSPEQSFPYPCTGDDCVFSPVPNWRVTPCGIDATTCADRYQFFRLTHVYQVAPESGDHTVTIVATDDEGAPSSPVERALRIAEVTLSLQPVTPLFEGGSTSLAGSVDNKLGDPFSLRVDWGDGSAPSSATWPCAESEGCVFTEVSGSDRVSFTIPHRYAENPISGDPYLITAEVVRGGSVSVTRTTPVTVVNLPPVLQLHDRVPCGPDIFCLGDTDIRSVQLGDQLLVRGRVFDPGGDAGTLVVDWGDGSPEQSFAFPCEGAECIFSTTPNWTDPCDGGVCVPPYLYFGLEHTYAEASDADGFRATFTAIDDEGADKVAQRLLFVAPEGAELFDPPREAFIRVPASQWITFLPLPDATVADEPFVVSAIVTSALPVTFTGSGACSVGGATVTPTGVGTCTVTASQGGNENWLPATSVDQSFTVEQGAQSITFGHLTDQAFSVATFTVSATASSGLAVTFTSEGACSVDGVTVTLIDVGNCTVTASQGGNENWLPAASVDQSFNIERAAQSIDLARIRNQFFGAAPFDVSAVATSGLAVTLTVDGVCSIDGVTVTLTGLGDCTVRADQAGDSKWLPAPTRERNFSVSAPATTPSAPTELVVVAGATSVEVSWVKPTNDGGTPITGYRLGYTTVSAAACRTDSPGTATTATTTSVTGLSSGASYWFCVAAVNAAGVGAAAVVGPVTLSDPTPDPRPDPTPPGFTTLDAVRVLDTRDQRGFSYQQWVGTSPTPAGATITIPITGSAVPNGATAVVVNLTTTRAFAPGYLVVYACDTARPDTSNANFAPGVDSANLAIAPVSAQGTICLYTSATTDLIVDVFAYATANTAGASYTPQTPQRLVDTRTGAQPTAGATIRVPLPPGEAHAVTVTADRAAGHGYLTVHDCATARPATSTVNHRSGATAANLAIVSGTELCVYTSAGADILIDHHGTLVDTVVSQQRLVDTRTAGAASPPGTTIEISTPTTDGSAFVNITTTGTIAPGYLVLHACDQPAPATSNINARVGEDVANLALVPATGRTCVTTTATTHIIVDLVATTQP